MLMREVGYKDRDRALYAIGGILGRTIESRKELYEDEMEQIEALMADLKNLTGTHTPEFIEYCLEHNLEPSAGSIPDYVWSSLESKFGAPRYKNKYGRI